MPSRSDCTMEKRKTEPSWMDACQLQQGSTTRLGSKGLAPFVTLSALSYPPTTLCPIALSHFFPVFPTSVKLKDFWKITNKAPIILKTPSFNNLNNKGLLTFQHHSFARYAFSRVDNGLNSSPKHFSIIEIFVIYSTVKNMQNMFHFLAMSLFPRYHSQRGLCSL